MGCLEVPKLNFSYELEKLVEHFKNEELWSVLQNTNPSDWVCNNGTTLLHLGVTHKNLDFINYLLNNGYDVNAKNSSGKTALLSAVQSNNFEAAKILLDADADVRVIDTVTGKNILEILSRKPREKIQDTVPHLVKNLKRMKLECDMLVGLLVESNCRLNHVFALNDLEISRKFLERCTLGTDGLFDIEYIVKRGDVENVELIMSFGNKSARIKIYSCLTIFMDRKKKLWQTFIKRVPDWDIIDRETCEKFNHMLLYGNADSVQTLRDLKIDLLIRDKFGIDLRAALFGNKRVDAIKLLQNEDFCIHTPSVRQSTALQCAAKHGVIKNVQFLLDSGVDINAKNEQGRTAPFECMMFIKEASAQLLLEYGADVQVVDNNGMTVFELATDMKTPTILELFIAQLAIDNVKGVPIKQIIQSQIDSNEVNKQIYNTCCQQLQALKSFEVVTSLSDVLMEYENERPIITLFTLLTGEIDTLCRYLCNQDTISLLDRYKSQHELHAFYYSTLKNKLTKISKLYYLKCFVSDVISESTGKLFDYNHLVISEILKNLTRQDVYEFFAPGGKK